MSKAELKQLLHEGIDNIESEYLLRKLYKVMEEEPDIVEEPAYQLSPEQKARIQLSREQFKKGEYITDEELQKRVDKWLKE